MSEFDSAAIPHAILSIEPKELDFGVVTQKETDVGHGKAILTITNVGTRVLVGRITLQVGWLGVDPPDFRLNPNESREHTFVMTKLPSAVWKSHRLGSDFAALINSNGGSETLSGFYYTDLRTPEPEEKKTPVRHWIFALLFVVIAMAVGVIYGLSYYLKRTDSAKKTEQIAMLYTVAAETYIADMTESAPTPTSPFGNSADMASINSTAAAYGAAMIQGISGSSPTNTPWPDGKYPSADQFIISYYSYLNEKDFDTAWWMLSENMQQTCCYSGEGTPIENYRALMTGITSIEVNYAYLQAYNVNPAEVRMELTYHHNDGTTTDAFYTAYIIDDALQNTLLIDEIK